MSINLIQFKNGLTSVLNRNPNIRNNALSGVIEAQIVNFKGHIQVTDTYAHVVDSDGNKGIGKRAKEIYISPYGYWEDLLVSIKRIFTGVVFGKSNEDLGLDLKQGRRITILTLVGESKVSVNIESDKQPFFHRIYKAVFRS